MTDKQISGEDMEKMNENCPAGQHEEELYRLRRWLHQHPECSMQEHKTSRFIAEYLETQGLACRRTGETGVIAELTAAEDLPWLAVRAEIDGLPVMEETGLPFASLEQGKMHACGHDAITAVVLCLARVLAEHRSELKYNIRFLFEPAEETGEGAKYLIRNGALSDPCPSGILVFHFGNQEERAMEIQKSISTAAIGGLQITVQGKGSHWSQREEGVDALYGAACLVTAIHTINETFRTKHPFVLGFGLMQAGKSGNIVADSACLIGSLRAFTEEDFEKVYEELVRIICLTEQQTGTEIKLELTKKIPPIINDPDLVKKGEMIGKELFGEKFYLGEKPFLAGDNAAYYMEKIPGMRAVFLAGKHGRTAYPVHNSRFDIDEAVMLDAMRFLYRFCTE